jgi:CheY-like chemotaxis protein
MTKLVEGRVAIIEDNEGLVFVLKTLIILSKHKVVLEALTRQEAEDKIKQRVEDLGEIALDAVILDDNLGPGKTNQDGIEIAKLLRESPGGEDLFILSMSATDRQIPGTSMMKSKNSAIEVVQTVDMYLATSLEEIRDRSPS